MAKEKKAGAEKTVGFAEPLIESLAESPGFRGVCVGDLVEVPWEGSREAYRARVVGMGPQGVSVVYLDQPVPSEPEPESEQEEADPSTTPHDQAAKVIQDEDKQAQPWYKCGLFWHHFTHCWSWPQKGEAPCGTLPRA